LRHCHACAHDHHAGFARASAIAAAPSTIESSIGIIACCSPTAVREI